MNTPGQTLEVIPAVDVLDGKVVRLLRGDYARVTEYGSDPVETARSWVDQGAQRVHVVDLDGARSGEPDLSLWSKLGRAGVVFQAGGGIRSASVARHVLEAGADRVVMGTAAVWEPERLASFGSDVVAAVDVRNGRATGSGWLDPGREIASVLDGLAAAGVVRVLVTGIGRDGTLEGVDLGLTRTVAQDGRFAVIASGGVGALSDLDPLAALGCEAAVVGRALYDRRFTLAEARSRFGG
ncbi:MAG TPA: 1-(5-phosphoribosyl)-5-[(5-phosphoribosylamino)methylideneamino] imidazole-4-carboxamide isomerase [Acidimicrobiia bacterium]|nr:1-(5-phosphoribosyl)-5-[(5-phosphoribosylamino)methylideneamino] imidazole-4-carboxamide isomerase [Acidimicrobiia bacterium]